MFPKILAKGEKITVMIDYFPAEVGDDTGMLMIKSNDPDTDVVMVSLTGSGFDPNGGGNLEIREYEAFLTPNDNSAIRTTGYAQIIFNKTGTEAGIKLSVKGRDTKGRGSRGRDNKGFDSVTVMGSALYCGAPEMGQELFTIFDFSDDGGKVRETKMGL